MGFSIKSIYPESTSHYERECKTKSRKKKVQMNKVDNIYKEIK